MNETDASTLVPQPPKEEEKDLVAGTDQTRDAKHTPLPWKVRSHDELGSFVEAKIEGKAYGQEILADDYFDGLSKEADCKFIVRACNSHDELVSALDYALDCWKCESMLTDSVVERMQNALTKARLSPDSH